MYRTKLLDRQENSDWTQLARWWRCRVVTTCRGQVQMGIIN